MAICERDALATTTEMDKRSNEWKSLVSGAQAVELFHIWMTFVVFSYHLVLQQNSHGKQGRRLARAYQSLSPTLQ